MKHTCHLIVSLHNITNIFSAYREKANPLNKAEVGRVSFRSGSLYTSTGGCSGKMGLFEWKLLWWSCGSVSTRLLFLPFSTLPWSFQPSFHCHSYSQWYITLDSRPRNRYRSMCFFLISKLVIINTIDKNMSQFSSLHFRNMISFNPHKDPKELVQLPSTVMHWLLEELRNMIRVTQ